MSSKKFLLVGIMFLFSVSCFYSCKKNNTYRAVIKVSMLDEFNNKVPVPECKLVFGKDNFAPDVRRVGYTDKSGVYEGEWTREVTLPVDATRDINGSLYSGYSVIRLTLDGIAEQEILIKE